METNSWDTRATGSGARLACASARPVELLTLASWTTISESMCVNAPTMTLRRPHKKKALRVQTTFDTTFQNRCRIRNPHTMIACVVKTGTQLSGSNIGFIQAIHVVSEGIHACSPALGWHRSLYMDRPNFRCLLCLIFDIRPYRRGVVPCEADQSFLHMRQTYLRGQGPFSEPRLPRATGSGNESGSHTNFCQFSGSDQLRPFQGPVHSPSSFIHSRHCIKRYFIVSSG